jgi:dihydrofolate synthase/folylpolyglutamate synthase
MSYQTAIETLSEMIPELHTKPGQPRRKFSLDEFRTLLVALGNPQNLFRSVLIAGTNGKGSTASTLASILKSSGMRVGLYTSPHLERVNERIRIGATEIADEEFGTLFFYVYETAERLVRERVLPQLPSFFEILTAQAMLYFAEQKVELAVFEVGMGGRLDATNVVEPMVSVITDISLDHTEWLGSTVAAITREKAGILRRGGTLITLPQDPEASRTLEEIASELGVKGINASEFLPPAGIQAGDAYFIEAMGGTIEVASPLPGAHQQRNVALAIAASVELATAHGLPISAVAIREGIRQTCWPGRLERIDSNGVEWILDVAHNPAGAEALRASLSDILREGKPRLLIFSCLRDKNLKELSRILFPLFDEVIFAPIHSLRAVVMEDLEAAGREAGVPAAIAKTVGESLCLAKTRAKGGVVIISGSVYLVGEARSLLLAGGIE